MDYHREMKELVHVVDRRCELCLGVTSLLVSSITLGIIVFAGGEFYDTFDQSGLYHNITRIVKIACKELHC